MIDEPHTPNVPEWIISFGDMMSLLLTFFIMLASFSEPKRDDKYDALMVQLQKQFGSDASKIIVDPNGLAARQASLAKGLNEGRALRKRAVEGIVAGDANGVRMIRTGGQTAIGTVVFFEEGSDELTEKARKEIRAQATAFAGKPQKIEIRGHTSLRAIELGSTYADNWELAYQRTRAVMRFLTDELQFDSQRIRLSIAGPNEPMHLGVDPAKMRENPRVELYLLEEVVSELNGTPQEREQRFKDPTN
jgi:chemotaxis protein MotB